MFDIIIPTLLFLIPICYIKFVNKKSLIEALKELIPKSQGWKKETTGAIALFGALFLGFLILTMGISFFEMGTGIVINDLDKVGNVIGNELAFDAVGFILLMIVLVFLEEFFFRSFLVPRIGMVISTIFFMIVHYGYNSISELIGAFFLGLILAYWFKKKGSLIQNYFGHLFYNILAILFYILL